MGMSAKAEQLLGEMKMQQIPAGKIYRSYVLASSASLKAEKWDTALQLLQYITSEGFHLPPRIYSKIMLQLAKAARQDEAMKLLKRMIELGISPDESTYALAISSCLKARDWQVALNLFEYMCSKGVSPSVNTYTAIIQVCSRAKKLKECEKMFQKMKEENIPPNIHTYSAMITAYLVAGNSKSALQLYDRSLEAGFTPNEHMYIKALHACGRLGDSTRAFALFDQFLNEGYTPKHYVMLHLFYSLVSDGLWEKSISLLDNLPKLYKIQPTVRIYNAVLSCISQSSCVPSVAFDVFEDMRNNGLEPNWPTYDCLTLLCIQNQDYDTALQLFSEIRQSKLMQDASAFNRLLLLHKRCGDQNSIKSTFDEMKRHHIQPDAFSYNVRVSASTELEEIMELWSDMQMNKVVPNQRTFNVFIFACAQNGYWSKAFDFLLQMEKQGIERSLITYNILLSSLPADGSAVEQASFLLNHMQQSDVQPDAVSYTCAIKTCGHAGRSQLAFRMYEEAIAKNITPDSQMYETLIGAHGDDAEWKQGLELIQQLHGTTNELRKQYLELITACLRSHNYEGALGVYTHLVESEPGCNPDLFMCNGALLACSKLGRGDKARSIFEIMRKFKLSPNDFSFVTAFTSFVASDMWEEAYKVLLSSKNEDVSIQVNVFNSHAVDVVASKGESSRILEMISCMNKLGVRPNAETASRAFAPLVRDEDLSSCFFLLDGFRSLNAPIGETLYGLLISLCESKGENEKGLELLRDALADGYFQNVFKVQEDDFPLLDLHCQTLGVSFTLIRHFIAEMSASKINGGARRLWVVTGLGNHVLQDGRRGVLRENIGGFIQEQLQYPVTVPTANPGMMLVTIPHES